jgi:hypothetical protein
MIITLCGSARFEPYFKLWNEVLSLLGHTVYSLAVYPSDKAGVKSWYNEEEKLMLDKVHKDKIKASDAVLILNKFGYVGDSTLSEIAFAREHGKILFALESWGKEKGVDESYAPHYRNACYSLIPEYKGSPIDSTHMGGFADVWDKRLWGSNANAIRISRMVADFAEKEKQIHLEKFEAAKSKQVMDDMTKICNDFEPILDKFVYDMNINWKKLMGSSLNHWVQEETEDLKIFLKQQHPKEEKQNG